MMKSGIVTLVLAATAFIGFGERTASALICCSACDEDPRNPACRHGCSPSCAVDEPIAYDNVVYDDVAQLCYASDQ